MNLNVTASVSLLTAKEIAEYCGCCRHTVYRLVKRGEIPHVRVGTRIRVRPSDLRAYLKNNSNAELLGSVMNSSLDKINTDPILNNL